jgi:hypothetical protein
VLSDGGYRVLDRTDSLRNMDMDSSSMDDHLQLDGGDSGDEAPETMDMIYGMAHEMLSLPLTRAPPYHRVVVRAADTGSRRRGALSSSPIRPRQTLSIVAPLSGLHACTHGRSYCCL